MRVHGYNIRVPRDLRGRVICRLLPIVLALFFGIIWFREHFFFFLHFIPKSTASIILDFGLIKVIICIIW